MEKFIQANQFLREALAEIGVRQETNWLNVYPEGKQCSKTSGYWNSDVFNTDAYEQVTEKLKELGFNLYHKSTSTGYHDRVWRLKSYPLAIYFKLEKSPLDEIVKLKARLAELEGVKA